ncbi:MAG: ABC transporter ATP-binding protein [Enterocloster asparagiformis]|nr:ABC transporter ATP-binding protein [Enterocloster asparagiformis]
MDRVVLNHVTYRYPIAEENALNDVSLRIKEGEFCSIIGANGSGKTTLCNVIRGFIPKFYQGDLEGQVLINGRDIAEVDLGSLATEVGFVFQNPFTQISGIANTVFEELAFGLENMGVEPDVIRRRVEDVLRLTKTEEFRDRNPYQLSGGQQQRIALAAILIMEQDIMVIDEPTSQLDPQSTDDVFEVIKLMKDMGRTIVLVEHKMEQIARYSDHIVVLDQGRVVLEGAPRDVITNPDCAKYHTRLPQCTNIGLGLKERGVDLGGLPITNDEAVAQIRNYMGR